VECSSDTLFPGLQRCMQTDILSCYSGHNTVEQYRARHCNESIEVTRMNCLHAPVTGKVSELHSTVKS
jgi:hypothetical protein